MYFNSEGFMNVEAENATEQFLTILRKWKNFNDAVIEDYGEEDCGEDDTVSFTFSEILGNVKSDLNVLAKECLDQGIELYGKISYYGDYNESYVIEDGKCRSFDLQTSSPKSTLQNNTMISPETHLRITFIIEPAFKQDKTHSNVRIEQAIAWF